ncbi:MAG: DUF3343 domain-containing protein [Deltaproteobacteria bacterium]|nr:DUF3343 domain-containing protein [Deltaproteobacteria bacterium]
MNGSPTHYVMLFKAVSYALKAEKILKSEAIPHKLIPVPKQISSDCGICLRFESNLRSSIERSIFDKVEFEEIQQLSN